MDLTFSDGTRVTSSLVEDVIRMKTAPPSRLRFIAGHASPWPYKAAGILGIGFDRVKDGVQIPAMAHLAWKQHAIPESVLTVRIDKGVGLGPSRVLPSTTFVGLTDIAERPMWFIDVLMPRQFCNGSALIDTARSNLALPELSLSAVQGLDTRRLLR
ncbi:uncharacterized protein L969DRAFT_95368 [Mixia osmundae IAM 14324]|uniref:Peptidase A1 domain-containing protein n=1 Tax=Mixia osmundae (strain CBS 9802 / IAM 14324 / JCM 22182 / KY 12970) TaxID=764103 RepID=G7DZ62_MIXOS|nr:uncharacterized protein L969DRAFT_95368 [Mixia osmundae IAM 14324]KEI38273.1 hypothetical protein L969DRAFT_95368 [Mixia osmundae IAM 14324]GAA95872.1 hypothetical protein E5Q_02529 [Mixia osmundae IAM 14324]